MRVQFAIFLVLPFLALGQSKKQLTKKELTSVYALAIGDFIKEANKKNKKAFDTLYFGKRKNNQPDDFPDIILPNVIENTVIKLITPEQGTKSQNEKQSRIYINLVGWAEKDNAQFVFFVFSNGFEHQYNYNLNYEYNTGKKNFELINYKLQEPPFDK